MGNGPPIDTGLMTPSIHCGGKASQYTEAERLTGRTYAFGGGNAPRVINPHLPLVQGCDGPDRLALFLGKAGVLEVGDRTS